MIHTQIHQLERLWHDQWTVIGTLSGHTEIESACRMVRGDRDRYRLTVSGIVATVDDHSYSVTLPAQR